MVEKELGQRNRDMEENGLLPGIVSRRSPLPAARPRRCLGNGPGSGQRVIYIGARDMEEATEAPPPRSSTVDKYVTLPLPSPLPRYGSGQWVAGSGQWGETRATIHFSSMSRFSLYFRLMWVDPPLKMQLCGKLIVQNFLYFVKYCISGPLTYIYIYIYISVGIAEKLNINSEYQ